MKLTTYYKKVLGIASLPVILATYFQRSTGESYDVGIVEKSILILRMLRNNRRIPTGSKWVEHLAMATTILRIPRSTPGCIVECGSYKGGSAANLSLVAALCGRDLEIFDSFAGLPEPSERDQAHTLLNAREIHTYGQGSWAGTVTEVKHALAKYGAIEVCNFHVGNFEATLPEFGKPGVFVFADVDLRDSLETCIRHLWPLLCDAGYFYTHEATHLEIASLFFDNEWWDRALGCDPPGLVGAGTGLGLIPEPGGFGSGLGYTIKGPEGLRLKAVPQHGVGIA